MSEYFELDWQTRQFTIPEDIKLAGVIKDGYSQVFKFKIPRYYKGHDIITYTIMYIDYICHNGERHQWQVGFAGADDTDIYFDWWLPFEATEKVGPLRVAFRAEGYDENWDEHLYRIQSTYFSVDVIDGIYGRSDHPDYQNKFVTSSFSEQIVEPDYHLDYKYLKRVTVRAMPMRYTENNAGGYTLEVG